MSPYLQVSITTHCDGRENTESEVGGVQSKSRGSNAPTRLMEGPVRNVGRPPLRSEAKETLLGKGGTQTLTCWAVTSQESKRSPSTC